MKNLLFVTTVCLGVFQSKQLYSVMSFADCGNTASSRGFIQQDQTNDSVFKKEMSLFTHQMTSSISNNNRSSALIEIPLQHCSESEVHLSLSKFNSAVSTFIHIYFSGERPKRRLDSIFIVTHSHFHVKMPQSAFEGVLNNAICNQTRTGKKATIHSPFFKAFYSKDKHRMYIYMTGGVDDEPYEVTWIFENDKYLKRVLTRIQ